MPTRDQPNNYITVEEHGDVLVATFKSRMLNDEENIEQLGQELYALVEQSQWLKMAINLSNVEYVTSSVIGKLITLHRKLHRIKGKLVLFSLSAGVDSVLRASKLETYFAIAENRDAAIALLAS